MLRKLLTLLLRHETHHKVKVIVSPFPGTWTHFACKREGNVITIYLNGEPAFTGMITANQLSVDSDNRIGLSHFNNNILQGEIKNFRFLDSALTDEDIFNLFILDI